MDEDKLTIEAVRGRAFDPLEGTQTLFAHLAPIPPTFDHGLASSLEATPNGRDAELVEFLFLRGEMRLARL